MPEKDSNSNAESDVERLTRQLEIKSWAAEKTNAGIRLLYKELEKKTAELERLSANLHIANETLLRAQKQITEQNRKLEETVRQRTELAEKRAQKLRELASDLTLTEQRERRRLAEYLHDNLQQILVAAKLTLNRLRAGDMRPEAEASAKSAADLVDQAIDSSRALTLDLSPAILRDGRLDQALEWLCRWFLERHSLKVDFKMEGRIAAVPEDIKVSVFRAVRELLFNTVKHSGADTASLSLANRSGEFCITVEDKGRGFRIEDVFSDGTNGFGLLNIRERVEMLGGRLEGYSEPGHGARFTLCIPQREPELAENGHDEQPAPPVRVRARHARMRVLIADDHRILRQGLINMLSDYPQLEVVGEASDGEEAVRQTESLMPDVVIMDISMPRMNGIEATQAIKERFPGVSVIGLSLHESADMAEPMRQAGAFAYLSKSGPIDDLISTIEQAALSGRPEER